MRIPGTSTPFTLFFDASLTGLHQELERAQQDPHISPEVRKEELWLSYLSEFKRFRAESKRFWFWGKPTAARLEQLATLYGCYLYWQERVAPHLGMGREFDVALRQHLIEDAISEEFEDLTWDL
jgi:hypothetical protein